MRPLKILLFGLLILVFILTITSQYTTYACDGGGQGAPTRILFQGNLGFEEIILGSEPFYGTLQINEPWIERNLVLGIDKIIIKQIIVPSSKIPINNKITIQSANIESVGAIRYLDKTLTIEKAKITDCADIEKVVRYKPVISSIFKGFFSPLRR